MTFRGLTFSASFPDAFLLAIVLEQLDLALEHVSKRDVHNARFGLTLTDNAVELVLHQIAKDQAAALKSYSSLREEYPNQVALNKALGRAFDAKVKFAKLGGGLSEEIAQTITIMHDFRNEVYHVGVQHEEILPELALFYFDVACGYLGSYKPRGLGWGSSQKPPDRAKKYFHGDAFFPGEMEDFGKGCATLVKASGHDAADTVAVLANHMDEVISQQDICIDIVARGVYKGQQKTRAKAVVDSLAGRLLSLRKAKRSPGSVVGLAICSSSSNGWLKHTRTNSKATPFCRGRNRPQNFVRRKIPTQR